MKNNKEQSTKHYN